MNGSAELSVLSWNIGRIYFGGRVAAALRWDSRADEAALEHVASVVARTGAEVVALQELRTDGQLERLAAKLGGGWVAAGPKVAGGDRQVGLLVRAQQPLRGPSLPVVAECRVEEVPLADGRTAEAVMGCRAGRRFAVLGVHFDAFRVAVRARQATAVGAWIDSRTEETVVIAGDLNMDLSFPLCSRLTDRLLWSALVGGRGLSDAGFAAGPTGLFRRRLDYVLHRGGRALEVRVLRGVRVPRGDHDPLFARLALGGAAATSSVDSTGAVP